VSESPAAPSPTRLGRWLESAGHALAWAFFAIFAIGVFEVVMRYVLGRPTSWVHVTSTSLGVVAFAAGGAYAMVQDQHMRVTVLSDRASPPLRRAGEWLGLGCGLVYLAGLLWGLGREAIDAVWRFDGGRWTPELTPGPPNWPLPALTKLALAIGALLFLLALADRVVRLLRAEVGTP
jgi:TRAP-type C4-dicarboxylate transport system permease small subunit